MKSISLTHIKRWGIGTWPNAHRWIGRQVRIWSGEHCAWWRPDGHGYTIKDEEAWVVDFVTAYERTEHCGSEKEINYFAVTSQTSG